jgi:hypothetical protein
MDRHGISLATERRVRAAARHRCGYCLSPQHLVMARLEIEHSDDPDALTVRYFWILAGWHPPTD